MDKISEKINIIFWKLVEIISLKLSDGKKPPPETNVIVKFNELKSRTPVTFNKDKNIKLKTQ